MTDKESILLPFTKIRVLFIPMTSNKMFVRNLVSLVSASYAAFSSSELSYDL